MNISLDFDGTASTDIETWTDFVHLFKKRGHTVYIVTMRSPDEALEIPASLGEAVTAVICTSREAKKPYRQALGIDIDIWIDDQPLAVTQPAEKAFSFVEPIAS